MGEEKIKILMVCLGNICRSPTAEIVFREKVKAGKLDKYITVDSAGTGSWHIGEPPDSRAMQAAKGRQYDMSALRARQVTAEDMESFDYIFAMDQENIQDLLTITPSEHQQKISLFLQHGCSEHEEVPDPYYSGSEGFELVLDLIEDASDRVLQTLAARYQWH